MTKKEISNLNEVLEGYARDYVFNPTMEKEGNLKALEMVYKSLNISKDFYKITNETILGYNRIFNCYEYSNLNYIAEITYIELMESLPMNRFIKNNNLAEFLNHLEYLNEEVYKYSNEDVYKANVNKIKLIKEYL